MITKDIIITFLVQRIKSIVSLIISTVVIGNANQIGNDMVPQYNGTYKASYYHNMFNNRRTSSGDIFHNSGYSCATSEPKFYGKTILFQSIKTKKMLRLKCNDRMNNRLRGIVHFDMSLQAMKVLSNSNSSGKVPGHIDLRIISIN